MYPKRKITIGEEIFRVDKLTNDKVQDVSFSVRAGEVLGIAGLVGSGRTEIARAIFGVDDFEEGELYLGNNKLNIRSPRGALKKGIGMVPENRKEQGVILSMAVKENMTMPTIKQFQNLGIINSEQEKGFCHELVNKLRIKTNSVESSVESLSGGNQQKVSLAKWFGANCKLIILDEPTRGVDVGAKVEIYKLINEFAAQGIGIIMISSEMTEIIGMCDRAAVMCRGKMTGILNKEELTEENIMRLAIGEGK